MALAAATLKTALQARIITEVSGLYVIEDSATLAKFAEAVAIAVANEVVTHITGNAVVNGTVTTGAGAGGAVIGTVL